MHYSIAPGQGLPVELRGVAGGADPGVRAELVEVEVGGGDGLQVKVATKFGGYFLNIRCSGTACKQCYDCRNE